jgi:hypothetical protein
MYSYIHCILSADDDDVNNSSNNNTRTTFNRFSIKTAVIGTSHVISKVLQCETWSLSGGVHQWLKRSIREKKTYYKRLIMIMKKKKKMMMMMIIIIIIIITPWNRVPSRDDRLYLCMLQEFKLSGF